MTAPTSPPPAPAKHRSRVSLWVALAALALGAIVAAFGARADVEANHRHEQVRKDDQQIRKYADARSTAVYFVKNGATIGVAMKRLQKLDDEDLGLMNDMRTALVAQSVSRFNSLKDSANNGTTEQDSLRIQVDEFQAKFTEALTRSSSEPSPSKTGSHTVTYKVTTTGETIVAFTDLSDKEVTKTITKDWSMKLVVPSGKLDTVGLALAAIDNSAEGSCEILIDGESVSKKSGKISGDDTVSCSASLP